MQSTLADHTAGTAAATLVPAHQTVLTAEFKVTVRVRLRAVRLRAVRLRAVTPVRLRAVTPVRLRVVRLRAVRLRAVTPAKLRAVRHRAVRLRLFTHTYDPVVWTDPCSYAALAQIHLLRPALGPLLRAEATVLRPGRQFHVVEAKVYSVPMSAPTLPTPGSSGRQAQAQAQGQEGAPRLVAWLTATIAVVEQRTPHMPSAL